MNIRTACNEVDSLLRHEGVLALDGNAYLGGHALEALTTLLNAITSFNALVADWRAIEDHTDDGDLTRADVLTAMERVLSEVQS